LLRIGISQKKYSFINIHRKNSDGIKFLENIRRIDPFDIIDVDETINDKESFLHDKIRGCWEVYFHNHQIFLNDSIF
jgi:hypothetical protein